jgi:hypothetical protein
MDGGEECGVRRILLVWNWYHVSTLERPELPTKTAEPWWPLRFADVNSLNLIMLLRRSPEGTFNMYIEGAMIGEKHSGQRGLLQRLCCL